VQCNMMRCLRGSLDVFTSDMLTMSSVVLCVYSTAAVVNYLQEVLISVTQKWSKR
jgi:hypothetical protein